MNIARLSALLLFTLMLIPMGASAHCKGKHDVPDHPHCDTGGPPDPGDPITHVVTLAGAFAFATDGNSVDVTMNKQGNELKSAAPVTLIRPSDSMLEMIWNSVFDKCPNFFAPTPSRVPGFTAPPGKKGWTIAKAGGVRVNFAITFPQDTFPEEEDTFPEEDFGEFLNPESAWVALSLIGDRNFSDPFPPTGPIPLSHFTIHGQTESGVTPRMVCDDQNFALEDFPVFPMVDPIYLTIKSK